MEKDKMNERLLTDEKQTLIKKLKTYPAFRTKPDALEVMAEMVIQLGYRDRAKTASLVRAELAQEKIDFGLSVHENAVKQCEAEIKALIKEMESSHLPDYWHGSDEAEKAWQALKQGKGEG